VCSSVSPTRVIYSFGVSVDLYHQVQPAFTPFS
jgi:hypothetical protein